MANVTATFDVKANSFNKENGKEVTYTLEYDRCDSVAELSAKYGEKVVTDLFYAAFVVAVQANVRRAMNTNGVSQEDAQEIVDNFNPSVGQRSTASKEVMSMVAAMKEIDLFAGYTEEQLKAIALKTIEKRKAAKKVRTDADTTIVEDSDQGELAFSEEGEV